MRSADGSMGDSELGPNTADCKVKQRSWVRAPTLKRTWCGLWADRANPSPRRWSWTGGDGMATI